MWSSDCFEQRIRLHADSINEKLVDVDVYFAFCYRIAKPFLLGRLLRYFSTNREEWDVQVYYYTAGFCLLPFLDCFIINLSLQTLMHVGMKVRVACCTLIYRKILRLSSSVLENETSVGQVTNELIKVDRSDLDTRPYFFPFFPVFFRWSIS